MPLELNLEFSNVDRFTVKLGEEVSSNLDFVVPINDDDRADIRWYLEVYSARYTADVDDDRARDIEKQLPLVVV